jgi:hypothetical protein
MTKLKLLSAGLMAAGLLAAPAMARENHVASRHLARDYYAAGAPGGHYIDGRLCTPAPRVGAFATQPWENDTPCQPAPAVY